MTTERLVAGVALSIGALGLARQKTWSLLALVVGAALLAATPSVFDATAAGELRAPPELGWIAASVIGLGVLAWVGPVVRALRAG